MTIVDVAAVLRDGMEDPELKRELRYLDGRLKIGIDGEQTTAEFDDGALVRIGGDVPDADCDIVVDGTREHWENLLQRYPKPFYQCLQTTAVKHGLKLSSTNKTFAYLPALNRLVVLMRQAYDRG
jgi:hypothetical protein